MYRMRRTQRALDNPALETAIVAANLLEQPVVVFFGLLARHPMANLRHYTFMIEGFMETAQKLAPRRIGFVARICAGAGSDPEFARFCAEVRPALVVCDEDPSRRDAKWKREALLYPSAPQLSLLKTRIVEKPRDLSCPTILSRACSHTSRGFFHGSLAGFAAARNWSSRSLRSATCPFSKLGPQTGEPSALRNLVV